MSAAAPQRSIEEVDFQKNIQDFWLDVKWRKSGNTQYSSGASDDGESAFAHAYNNPGKLRTKSNRSYSVSEEPDGRIHLPKVESVEETAQEAASGETDGRLKLPKVEDSDGRRETIQYSVGETVDGRPVAVVDSDILSNIDTKSWDIKKMREAIKAAKTALLAFRDGIKTRGIIFKVNKMTRGEYTNSKDTMRLFKKIQMCLLIK